MRRAARPLIAAAVLLYLAAPHWAATVDDVYITLSYARRWAEVGDLSWTTGERVEGYSNFLFLLGMTVLARLGVDIDVAAQVVALMATLALVVMLERRLPRSVGGSIALAALVTWTPVARWSVIGLETTFYALLLSLGWVALLRERPAFADGTFWLALASITRPEGALHVAAALLLLARSPTRDRRQTVQVGTTLLALCAYHIGRTLYFGAFTPTPLLVKVVPVGLTYHGVLQLGGDLLTGGGLLLSLLLLGVVPRRHRVWVFVPLLIQAATLIRASGDWMAWGRISMPGLVATAVAYAATASWRARMAPTLWIPLLSVVAACAMVEPRGYGTFDLRTRPWLRPQSTFDQLRHGLDTPVAEDVAWAIDNVPEGAAGLVVDAGILGDIPGFKLIDMRGLTHRSAALATARGDAEGWLRSVLADRATRPAFLRLANWESETHPDYPSWLVDGYALRADLRYGGGSIRWYADTDDTPSVDTRQARWDEVLRHHPSHPFLVWHSALTAAADGDRLRADALMADGHGRWPAMSEFKHPEAALSFASSNMALVWDGHDAFSLRCGEEVTSRQIAVAESTRLEIRRGNVDDVVLRLVDPCHSGVAEPVQQADSVLVGCAQPRRITLVVTCASAGGTAVSARLLSVPTPQ